MEAIYFTDISFYFNLTTSSGDENRCHAREEAMQVVVRLSAPATLIASEKHLKTYLLFQGEANESLVRQEKENGAKSGRGCPEALLGHTADCLSTFVESSPFNPGSLPTHT